MGFCIVDLLVPGLDIPLSPRSDDLDPRSPSLDREFESYLVIALSGCSVSDRISALCKCYLSKLLADDRTGESSSEKIFFILGTHLQRRNDNFIHHLVYQVSYYQLAGSCLKGLLFESVKLVSLSYVAGYSYDLRIIVVFLEPWDDYRSIKSP